MLKTTLSTTFTPGVNVKGEAVGANWLFLLPHFAQSKVLLLGAPAPTTLKALARVAHSITVLCREAKEQQALEATKATLTITNLTPLHFAPAAGLPLADQSIDLVVILKADSVRWLRQTPALWREVVRVRKSTGQLYYEYWGVRDPLQTLLLQTESKATAPTTAQPLWLTPLYGEMQTAVPTRDQQSIDYALRHGLYRSSVALKRWAGMMKGQKSRKAGAPPKTATAPTRQPTPKRAKPKSRGRINAFAKQLLAQSTKLLEQGERWLFQLPGVRQILQRRGVLVGSTTTLDSQPPAYLVELAATAGIDLTGYRWVLSAKGEYSTRKVLFFLMAPGAETPTYIVKMTRSAAFNYRLENEYAALAALYAKGIGNPQTFPKPLFVGRHADLSIVGESIVQGEPFARKSQRNANCPALQAAIQYLINLGTATADHSAASPQAVAHALQTLFDQFQAIYQLTPAQQAFLAEQIQQVAKSSAALPLVFQHGDPGPWNMLVTPDGQVALLDWEAAETQGIPLWDLFYFLRSYALDCARAQGINDGLRGFQSQFLADTPLSRLIVATVNRYCQTIDLPAHLVLPLFYTCWMHRALKEATRLTGDKLQRGRFVNLLRLCIDQQTAPTLQRLGQPPADQTSRKEIATPDALTRTVITA